MKKYLDLISKQNEFISLFLSEMKNMIKEEKNNKGVIAPLSVIEYFNSIVKENNQCFNDYYISHYGSKNDYILRKEAKDGFVNCYVESLRFNISKSKNRAELKNISIRKKIESNCLISHFIKEDGLEVGVSIFGSEECYNKTLDFRITNDYGLEKQLFGNLLSDKRDKIIENEASDFSKKLLKGLSDMYSINFKYRELIIESIILNKDIEQDRYDLLMLQGDFVDLNIYRNNKSFNLEIKKINSQNTIDSERNNCLKKSKKMV